MSEDIRDNILAILTDADREAVVEAVLRKLQKLEPRTRGDLALQFTILGGLRDAEEYTIEGATKMITMQDRARTHPIRHADSLRPDRRRSLRLTAAIR